MDDKDLAVSLELPDGFNFFAFSSEHQERSALYTPELEVLEQQEKQLVHDAVGKLRPREAKTLRLRFGLEDGIERTLEEVGAELGVSRERARGIQNLALRRLRHPSLGLAEKTRPEVVAEHRRKQEARGRVRKVWCKSCHEPLLLCESRIKELNSIGRGGGSYHIKLRTGYGGCPGTFGMLTEPPDERACG